VGAALAWTQTDLDKLEAAIATGARRVKYADKEVEYQSIDDMLKARDMIRRDLDTSVRPARVWANFSKGL
jgi:hypothetical protein